MAYTPNLFANNTSSPVQPVSGRVGSKLYADDTTGLFLKKFAGEVMTVFDEKNIMKPLHTIRTISKGKSAQFPVIGTANAGYYTPGSDILGNAVGDGKTDGGGINNMKQSEVLIHIDKILMSSTFISSIDELVSHFDVRAPYTHQLGEALANQFDKNVLKVAIKTGVAQSVKEAADRTAADATGLIPSASWIQGQTKRGSVVYAKAGDPTYAPAQESADQIASLGYDSVNTASAGTLLNKLRHTPTASVIRKALFESARLLDEKDVPSSDRFAIITPAMYYELVNNTSGTDVIGSSMINKDVGGEGSLAAGTITRVAGITLLVSNHLPNSAETGHKNNWIGQTGNDYNMDYSDVAGIVFQKGGFGTLKLQDLTMESEYLIQRQGNIFVAKYSMGHGPLRPESVVVWSDGLQPGDSA
jgi:hypothetical protein